MPRMNIYYFVGNRIILPQFLIISKIKNTKSRNISKYKMYVAW